MKIPDSSFDWWAVKLSAIAILVFVLAQASPDYFYSNFTLVSSLVLVEPWRVLTHLFMHADLSHLYFNLFALAVFGSIFEKKVGSRVFLTVFFLGGLAASVADVIFYPSTLGASGAIFAVLGALAIYRPKTVVWAIGVPMYVIIAFFIWISLDLLGMFQPDGIAHASHLAGMAYGGAYGFYLRKIRPQDKAEPEKKAEGLPSEKDLEAWESEWMK
jgi:membrane associated rhomboid family serine protease